MYFTGTREQKSKNEGTGEQKQFWETGNIENEDLDFGDQGKIQGTREQVSPPPHGRPSYFKQVKLIYEG